MCSLSISITRPCGEIAAVGVLGEILAHPDFLGNLVDRVQLVGLGFVGPEDAEVVQRFAASLPRRKLPRVGTLPARVPPGDIDLDGEVAEVGQVEGPAQQAAVGHRIGAHAAVAGGSQGLQFRNQAPLLVKCFSG